MKLCIDCKHHHLYTTTYTLETNQHGCDVDGIIDPVDGSKRFRMCADMRDFRHCGPEGKLWEPKEPKPSS